MKCYFDTSIYNRILDDPDKDLVLQNFKNEQITAIPSLVNLCELLQTANEARKQSLLGIYNHIRDDYHPLKPFPILLKDAVLAVQEGNIDVNSNMPVAIDDTTKQLCAEALKDPGKEFDKYALKARDRVFSGQGVKPPPDAKTFFKASNAKEMNPTWINLFVGVCKGLGIEDPKLDEATILSMVKNPKSPWKYYFDTTLLYFHRRAMRIEGYGKKSNPGGADLEQGIYLCWADIYVIKDGAFYEFMKELKELLGYKKEIFDYDEFKEFLALNK